MDLERLMFDENDEPILLTHSGKQANLRELIILALAHPDRSQEDMAERWELIKTLKNGGSLTNSDKPLCIKWASKTFLSPVIMGRVIDSLT